MFGKRDDNGKKTKVQPEAYHVRQDESSDTGECGQELATFKLHCRGRDGKLCLFEDAHGHFTAVRADRLA